MSLTEGHTISNTVSDSIGSPMTVSSLVKDAIGNRTITKFCEESGLSTGYVSRLLNGRLKSIPNVKTLAKISCISETGDKQTTFKNLLKLCGHNLSIEQMQREILIAERTSEIMVEERNDAKLGNYDSLNYKASAIGLLFSNLMMMGVPLKPLGYFGPHDGIEIGIEGYQFKRMIVIFGFCGNSHQVTLAKKDILRQLLKYVSSQKDVPLYLVLTDHKEVFEFISDVLDNTVKAYVYVLLTNNEHSHFVCQNFYAADEEIREQPFDFVK